jgi:hypothetical protein
MSHLTNMQACLSAFFTAGTHPAYAQTPPGDFVPGEVLVKFEPGASGANLCSTNDCVRDRILTEADQIPGLTDY